MSIEKPEDYTKHSEDVVAYDSFVANRNNALVMAMGLVGVVPAVFLTILTLLPKPHTLVVQEAGCAIVFLGFFTALSSAFLCTWHVRAVTSAQRNLCKRTINGIFLSLQPVLWMPSFQPPLLNAISVIVSLTGGVIVLASCKSFIFNIFMFFGIFGLLACLFCNAGLKQQGSSQEDKGVL